MPVVVSARDSVCIVTIDRFAEARNAVDGPTARALADALRAFDANDALAVCVINGDGGGFCAGADLKAAMTADRGLRLAEDGDGPMGFSRLALSKPTIAAIEGHAVAGGLELALFCDMRVAARDAVFGVFCRRWGVPLVDGGTIRLARLIGESRALDMILTGRPVSAEEALQIGLANRVVEKGHALEAALGIADQIAAFPQACVRSDRRSVKEQWHLPMPEALVNEFRLGMGTIESGETRAGIEKYGTGAGRHGSFSS